MDKNDITVIIPIIKDNIKQLLASFTSLQQQNDKSFYVKLFISDDCSKTIKFLGKKFACPQDYEIIVHSSETLPELLNYATMYSITEYILFLYPGVIFKNDWIYQMRLLLKRFDVVQPHIVEFVNMEFSVPNQLLFKMLNQIFITGFGNEKGFINLKSLAIKRSILLNEGLFNKFIPYIESIDLYFRLKRANISIYFDKDASHQVEFNYKSKKEVLKVTYNSALNLVYLIAYYYYALKQGTEFTRYMEDKIDLFKGNNNGLLSVMYASVIHKNKISFFRKLESALINGLNKGVEKSENFIENISASYID